MSEKIKIPGGSDASLIVFEAMVKSAGPAFMERFAIVLPASGLPTVDVVMTVNGVDVPVVETLQEAWDRAAAEIDHLVEDRAVELVQGSGLADLLNTLRDSEWRIRDAISRWTEKDSVSVTRKGRP